MPATLMFTTDGWLTRHSAALPTREAHNLAYGSAFTLHGATLSVIFALIMRRSRQLELCPRTWGGRREGAGRKPSGRRVGVPHRRRPAHDPRCPVHVTLHARAGLASLRSGRVFARVAPALCASSRGQFRILHYTVQSNHLHLVVEADGHRALWRGLQGLAVRVAKAVNRVLGRRGSVWSSRYHARLLTMPRMVRNALAYVLRNGQKHRPAFRGLDPCSSAAWFEGWRQVVQSPPGPSPVVAAQTWLARVGWRRGGLVDVSAVARGHWVPSSHTTAL